jgi:hypothetical protein
MLGESGSHFRLFAGNFSHSMYPFQPGRFSAKVLQESSSSESTPFTFGSSSKRSLA